MSDSIETTGRGKIAVGAIGITYQATLIDGKTLAFETMMDSSVDREGLGDFMDVFIDEAARQQAKQELPLIQESLIVNRLALREAEKRRAMIVAANQARHLRINESRRNAKPIPAEGDEANLVQLNQAIENLKAKIRAFRAKIPYLQAVIRRDPNPPSPFPAMVSEEEDSDTEVAA